MAKLTLVAPLGDLLGPADEIYLSFEEMPHDKLPPGYQDGDDSVHAESHARALQLAIAFDPADAVQVPKAAKVPRKVIVPHPRDLARGDVGSDVLMLQRALAAAGLRKWAKFTRADGAGTVAEVKTFQAAHDIPASGVYGEATHRALSRYYDAFGISMLTQYAARTAVDLAQKRMLSAMMVAYNYRDRNHYTQGSSRWMMISNHIHYLLLPQWSATWGDCSAFFTWGYWAVNVPDPNRLYFAGGYTGTLGAHGTVIDPSKAKVGAAFLYGPGTHEHVQMSVGGENTIGDGSEAGPLYLPAGYRGDLNVVREYPGLSLAA